MEESRQEFPQLGGGGGGGYGYQQQQPGGYHPGYHGYPHDGDDPRRRPWDADDRSYAGLWRGCAAVLPLESRAPASGCCTWWATDWVPQPNTD